MALDSIGTTDFTDIQIADLAKSGISVDDAIRCGIRCIGEIVQVREILNVGYPDTIVPALLIPYFPLGDISHKPTGYRVKPDHPLINDDGKVMKYLQPKDVPTSIYFPTVNDQNELLDPKLPLFLTEGEKKAGKLALEGYLAIAAPGVWNFHSNDSESISKTLKKCFDSIPLKGREVRIIFDLLEFEKSGVLHAKLELAKMLCKKGARPYLLHLSADHNLLLDGSDDLGVDDYLSLYGKKRFDEVIVKNAIEYPISKFLSNLSERLKALPLEEFDRVKTMILTYYSFESDTFEKCSLKGLVVKLFEIGRRELNALEKEVKCRLISFQKTRPNRVDTNGKLGINWCTSIGYDFRQEQITKALIEKNLLYYQGSIPCFYSLEKRKMYSVSSEMMFTALISEYLFFYIEGEPKNKDEAPERTYCRRQLKIIHFRYS